MNAERNYKCNDANGDVREHLTEIAWHNGLMGDFSGVVTPAGPPDEWTDDEASAYNADVADALLAALAERGLTIVGTGALVPRPTPPHTQHVVLTARPVGHGTRWLAMGYDPRQRSADTAHESACPEHPLVARAPHCHTYIACPTAYRTKCDAAQRCTGEDETMG